MKAVLLDINNIDNNYVKFQRSARFIRGLSCGVLVCIFFVLPISFFLLPLPSKWTLFLYTIIIISGYFSFYAYFEVARAKRKSVRIAAIWLSAQSIVLMFPLLGVFDLQTRSAALAISIGIVLHCSICLALLEGLFICAFDTTEDIRRIYGASTCHLSQDIPAGIISGICKMIGLIVPPGEIKLPRFLILAAVLGAILEGSAYFWYIRSGFLLMRSAVKTDTNLQRISDRGMQLFDYSLDSLVFFGFLASVLVNIVTCYIQLLLARSLRDWAQRRSIVAAKEAIATDERSPVLFLRSFQNDQVSLASAPVPFYARHIDPSVNAGNLDVIITRNFNKVGPVIALGHPDDKAQPLGATRYYKSHNDWQLSIRKLIYEASFIVLALDNTPGLQFEIDQILALDAFHKTILIVPPEINHHYTTICTLSRIDFQPPPNGDAIVAILFDSQGTAIVLHSAFPHELTYELTLLAMLAGSPQEF